MSESNWSDISLETAACLLVMVIAYKLYRMRISAESECCGGSVNVRASNPGNSTPRALRGILGSSRGDIEEAKEGASTELAKPRLVRTTNELTS